MSFNTYHGLFDPIIYGTLICSRGTAKKNKNQISFRQNIRVSLKTHSYSLRNFLAASKLDTRLSICIIWQIFEKTCVHFELYRLNAAQGSLAFKATANRERAFTLEDTQEKESLLSRPTHDNAAQEILGNIL